VQLQSWMRGLHVTVLGSGASADYGYPLMSELASHLRTSIIPKGGTEAQWDAIRGQLDAGTDVETALTETHCAESLIEQIVLETWKYVSDRDLEFYRRVADGKHDFPLARLLSWLDTSRNKIDVVTTNYDRVVEYACDAVGLTWLDGTGFGYLKRGMKGLETQVRDGPKGTIATVVRIWKVHGSLDWFSDEADATFSARVLQRQVPDRTRPLIVTPGQTKYERAFDDPFRTILAGADNVMKQSNSFLCVGYGFNDKHVHTKLLEKARDPQARFIIACRKLTESTKKFLMGGACRNFIAIEEAGSPNQSLVWQSAGGDPISVAGKLWSISGLCDLVL